MEEGCPSLADQLATCQQRIRDLEQTTADQQAVIAQKQEAVAPGDTAALEGLLSDRWLAVHPEHRLEQREEESREAQARRRRMAVAQ